MRAAIVPGTLDPEARTVEVIWTTGERVLRGFFSRFFEELSLNPEHVRMGRLSSGNSPVLNSHRAFSTESVVGVVTAARLDGDRGIATLQFSDDESSEVVFRKVATGILRNVSVGYRVHRFEQVEGGDEEIPTFRAVDWEPMEISVVPIGADSGAAVRGHDAGENNDCEFVRLAREQSMGKETLTPTAPENTPIANTETRSEPAPKPAAPAPATLTAEQESAIRAAETKRCQEIHRISARIGLGDEFAQKHIANGTDLNAFRAAAMDSFDERNPPAIPAQSRGSVELGEDEREKWVRGAGNWLAMRAGVTSHVRAAHERYGIGEKDTDPGEFRGMSLMDLARESLERSGVKTRGLARMEIARLALQGRSSVMGAATTSDFPVLLENILHKTLLGAYAITPDKWRRFCAVGSVSDFRVHNRYRQGTFGRLDKVLESGEFQNKSIPDARKETIIAETYGNIIAITRQTLINDDMGAFNTLATRLGRAAGLSIEVDVFALLAENSGLGPLMEDGDPLFDANHNNIATGAALSIAAIDADLVVLANQVDESGNEVLELEPNILLVNRAQESQALNINGSEFDVDADALGNTRSRVPNVVRGKFADVVASTRTIDATRRYIFADPNDTPTLEVAFLDGQETPVLEMQEGFRVDGMEWKVRLDYGTSAVDYRGAVTNAGV